MRIIISLMILIAFLSGCQTTGKVKAADLAPDWLTGEPKIEGMICAVGMSEPTFYKKEAWQYAAEDARKALARTLSIEINTLMVDITSEKGSSIDEATTMEVSSWATKAVVRNSKIIEYWHDAKGIVSQKDVTYALACMPRKLKFDK